MSSSREENDHASRLQYHRARNPAPGLQDPGNREQVACAFSVLRFSARHGGSQGAPVGPNHALRVPNARPPDGRKRATRENGHTTEIPILWDTRLDEVLGPPMPSWDGGGYEVEFAWVAVGADADGRFRARTLPLQMGECGERSTHAMWSDDMIRRKKR